MALPDAPVTLPDPPRCDGCVFFVPRPDLYTDFDAGECHYSPPKPALDIQMVQWPLVRADTFCGQWQDVW